MFKFPLIASAIVHATIVAVAVVGGHGASTSALAPVVPTLETIPVDVTQPEVPPLLPANVDPQASHAHPHSHTHDYPVPASHDDRPHDPSLVHEHEVIALPAPAAPQAPPVFSIVVGPAIAPHAGVTSAHGIMGNAEPSAQPLAEASVSVAAHLVSSVPPVYPPAARAAEVEADVVLEIVLDDAGRVSDAKVTRTAGYGLDKSALDAIRGYRFSAAQKDDRPVRVRMHWTVQFRLR